MSNEVFYAVQDITSLTEDFMTTAPRPSIKLQAFAGLLCSARDDDKKVPWVVYVIPIDYDYTLSSYLNFINQYFRQIGAVVNWCAFQLNDLLEIEIFHQVFEEAETDRITEDMCFEIWRNQDDWPLISISSL